MSKTVTISTSKLLIGAVGFVAISFLLLIALTGSQDSQKDSDLSSNQALIERCETSKARIAGLRSDFDIQTNQFNAQQKTDLDAVNTTISGLGGAVNASGALDDTARIMAAGQVTEQQNRLNELDRRQSEFTVKREKVWSDINTLEQTLYSCAVSTPEIITDAEKVKYEEAVNAASSPLSLYP